MHDKNWGGNVNFDHCSPQFSRIYDQGWNVTTTSCVALTQVECNLPAIYSSDSSDCVSRDSRSRTWTFQGGRRGKNIPRYYSTFPPLLSPSLLFTRENFLPRNKFDCRFQATLGLENNCPRLENSRAEEVEKFTRE